jgi:hypothetical protein
MRRLATGGWGLLDAKGCLHVAATRPFPLISVGSDCLLSTINRAIIAKAFGWGFIFTSLLAD